MPFKDPHTFGILETVLFSLLAAVGGLFAYLMRTLNGEDKPQWARALVEAGSSGFVGLVAMLACDASGLSWQWSGVVVGVFGWLGAETSIAVFARLIRNKLGVKK